MENFIKNPNLPDSNISLAIVDGRIPNSIEKNLQARNIRLIKTEPIKDVYQAVSYHPDIMLCYLGRGDIVAAPNISNALYYALENEGLNIKLGSRQLKTKYPYDIHYNVAIIGSYFICSLKNTDEVLLNELYSRSLKPIDVKQGYAKCSICIVSENKIITSDKGIADTLQNTDIEALLISEGDIQLFNMNYGFIGGASGKISKSELAFYGKVTLHNDFEKIKKFLYENEKKIINLSENKLLDLGTLLPLKEYSI